MMSASQAARAAVRRLPRRAPPIAPDEAVQRLQRAAAILAQTIRRHVPSSPARIAALAHVELAAEEAIAEVRRAG